MFGSGCGFGQTAGSTLQQFRRADFQWDGSQFPGSAMFAWQFSKKQPG
jgi:hypothetical protein